MRVSEASLARLRPEFRDQCLAIQRAREFQVEERASDGAAEVILELPEPRECLHFRAEPSGGTRWFQYLKPQTCADGALLVPMSDGSYAAHIVECKASLDASKWVRVKQQFLGALLRLHAIAGLLGLSIERIQCYTAFRSSQLVSPSSANMVSRHALLGKPAPPPLAAIADHADKTADLEWLGLCAHKDVPLSVVDRGGLAIGHGRVAIE